MAKQVAKVCVSSNTIKAEFIANRGEQRAIMAETIGL
jgi:hypothetical protein